MSNQSAASGNIKTNAYLNYFWTGFIIYSFGFVFPTTNQSMVYALQALQLCGILLFTISAYKLVNWEIRATFLRTVVIVILIWNFTILARGYTMDYEFIKRMLLYSNDGLFMYFLPLLVFFPSDEKYLKKVFLCIILTGFFFLISDLYSLKILLYASTGLRNATGTCDYLIQCLAIPSGFIILTGDFQKKRRIVLAFIFLLVALYFSIIRARRGMTFAVGSELLISYILLLFYNKEKLFKVALLLSMIAVIVSAVLLFYAVQRNGFFGYFDSRLDEDTRKGVEIAFRNDMKPIDWMIGKGINGVYYCPNIDEGYRVTIYRSAIETGYLQIILRGGIVSLALYILIMIPAILKGFFFSKNKLCKAAAAWIVLFMIFSYPMCVHWFILSTVLIWISIAICYNKDICGKTDEEILQAINYEE